MNSIFSLGIFYTFLEVPSFKHTAYQEKSQVIFLLNFMRIGRFCKLNIAWVNVDPYIEDFGIIKLFINKREKTQLTSQHRPWDRIVVCIG